MTRGYVIWEVDLDSLQPGTPVAKAPDKASALAEIEKRRAVRQKRDPIVHGIREYVIE